MITYEKTKKNNTLELLKMRLEIQTTLSISEIEIDKKTEFHRKKY